MKRNRRKALSQRGAYLKNRIARNRGRAQFTGIVYLLSIIALAVVACMMPMFDVEKQALAPLGIMVFWKQFTPETFKALTSLEAIITFANAVLYGLMLLTVVINVFRALGKLGWLFKKKASKSYGFNRNVYAMEDLGAIFSGSFASIILTYFVIAILCGGANPVMPMYFVLGGGIFIHFFAGIIGGKVSYFDIADGEISEEKRVVGRFSAFFRNVLQIAAVGAIMYFFLKTEVISAALHPILEKGGFNKYILAEPLLYIPAGLQILTFLCLIPLLVHATATTEYNIDGANGSGMKTFRVFSFFIFLTAGATVVCRYLFGEAVGVDKVAAYLSIDMIIVAATALVMFIIEVIMRNMPGLPKPKKNKDEDVEPNYEYAIAKPKTATRSASEKKTEKEPIYILLDNKAKKTAVVEKKAEEPKKEEPVEEEDEEAIAVGETEEMTYYNINCPHCGKALRVKSTTVYHRCPACKKVFQLRKVTKDVIV